MGNLFWSSAFILCFLTIIDKECNGKPVNAIGRRVCIIGAGYSGLATARRMKEHGLNFTVFEATRHIGGTWRFDSHVGTDEDGLPVFTSMYKGLRTNTPRHTLEYGGFPLPADTPTYPTGPCFYKYLKSFAKHYDLLKDIQFRSLVTSVRWKKDQWLLTYLKTDSQRKQTETCDFMVVANGYHSIPNIPKIEGMELFKGKIIHSHDYKEPEQFRNRRVLVVGAGPSGMDVVVFLSNVTSKLVHSHHAKFKEGLFPKNVIHKPDIESFTCNGALFQDGSYEEFDDVIFCTGFEYNHGFLDRSTELAIAPKFLMPLHQQMVNIKRPTMVFVGKLRTIIARINDVQAEYAAALAARKFKLPPQNVMLKTWTNQLYSLLSNGTSILKMNAFNDHYDTNEYFKSICQEAGLAAPPPVLDKIKEYNANFRLQNLLQYRDYEYEIVDDQNFITRYDPKGDICPMDE